MLVHSSSFCFWQLENLGKIPTLTLNQETMKSSCDNKPLEVKPGCMQMLCSDSSLLWRKLIFIAIRLTFCFSLRLMSSSSFGHPDPSFNKTCFVNLGSFVPDFAVRPPVSQRCTSQAWTPQAWGQHQSHSWAYFGSKPSACLDLPVFSEFGFGPNSELCWRTCLLRPSLAQHRTRILQAKERK